MGISVCVSLNLYVPKSFEIMSAEVKFTDIKEEIHICSSQSDVLHIVIDSPCNVWFVLC
jgi:hypothetical protein